MDTTQLTYPIFEANQVLTKAHLNDLFEYLDEQQRLTRANLIGIGVVCGLGVEVTGSGTVRLSRGCGITSQGYLVVEPEDLELVAVRPYRLPGDDPYPPGGPYAPLVQPGTDPPQQYDMWELFADDDEPGAQPLGASGLVLEDKALVLFLELRRGGLRTCSPSSCDDRGSQVTATVRRLLVDTSDLHEVADASPSVATLQDVGARLQLPDLRMPRYDVPNSSPVETGEVLAAFQGPFRAHKLVAATAAALSAAYDAFQPLVLDQHPTNPFTTFVNRYGFLDANPTTTTQVRFLQYYWDLFRDLLAAYDEVRWAGLDLMCACCPPEGLFPRHLVAGALAPAGIAPDPLRHRFVASPAVGRCEQRTGRFRMLFDRLVAMTQAFTDTPALQPPSQASPDQQIRITPSRAGGAPLGVRAIPYYYEQDGAPPLYRLWDPIKTERQRAHHNVGYRAAQQQPVPPDFVTQPLGFDLEPQDFLRIEGHLGKDVRDVVSTLLTLRSQHRLPFEVVALRTGAFDEDIEVDLSKERCRFDDLDALYAALTSELTCFLAKQIQYFFDLPSGKLVDAPEVMPTLAVLRRWAPAYRVRPGTLGRAIEANLSWTPGMPFVGFLQPEGVAPEAVRPTDQPDVAYSVYALTTAMSDLADRVTEDIGSLDITSFAERYAHLVAVAEQFDAARRRVKLDHPGLSDRIDDIVFRCRLDPLESLAAEYERRVRDVKQAQFLAHYAQHHPGLQHGAGVPLGGTFVVVYHESPALRRDVPPREIPPLLREEVFRPLTGEVATLSPREVLAARREPDPVEGALDRLQHPLELATDPAIQLMFRSLTGRPLVPKVPIGQGAAARVYAAAVRALTEGEVVADFFLPYQCCSHCPPIQYTLPPVRLRMDVAVACTGDDGAADVTVTVEGANGPVSVRVDDGSFTGLSGPLRLAEGEHTIAARDASGAETTPTTVTVPPVLAVGDPEVSVDATRNTFQVAFEITGGTPPYVASPGTVAGTVYTSPTLPAAEVLAVTVRDAAGCVVRRTTESGVEPCTLPCGGAAVRRGHRFWVPEAREGLPLNEYQAEVSMFRLVDADGTEHDLTDRVGRALAHGSSPISFARFLSAVTKWLEGVNGVVAEEVGSDQWLLLEYESAADETSTGVLWIDRLVCLELEFRLTVSFIQGRAEHKISVGYGSQGTEVHTEQSAVLIPPFGGSTSNKCQSDEQHPVCEGTDLKVEIHEERLDDRLVELRAEVTNGSVDAFLWEVEEAEPSLANGDHVVVTFREVEPGPKSVRLTAYDERGCWAAFRTVIEIDG
ncbi:hypothetical protein [Nocardioides sp.]|uniref:hypothetical protein n=1 Tax=Nocardioides sp. TaxID=35761 RepID=UPI0035B0A0D3